MRIWLMKDVACAQSALIARGRSNRQAKLLFYGKLAEKALGTYERDGWGEFPTQVGSACRFAARVVLGLAQRRCSLAIVGTR
jgi:hypothetical protein